MAYREFHDGAGAKWRVWDVYPQFLDRRSSQNRREAERESDDRRSDLSRVHVSPGLAEGWLCFERDDEEKRRLAPIPRDWVIATERQLADYCSAAHSVERRTAVSEP